MSPGNQRALELVKNGTKKLIVGYQIALRWREGEPRLENNRGMAELWLKCLLKLFQLNPQLEENYKAEIQKYIEHGYVKEEETT